MRNFRPLLLVLAIGCAPTESFQTAVPPEQDLRNNLREGKRWESQDEMMNDVKNALGAPSTADATGPAKGTLKR